MTPEQLDMHKRLQPLYKRVMGEWKAGDRAYRKSSIFGEPFDSQIWPEDKRTEIVSISYISEIKSYWHCRNEKGEERLLTDDDLLSATCWRCPHTIDSEHPERGLWGMLDWSKLYQEQNGPDGEIAIYKVPFINYCEELGIPIKDHPLVTDDPTTAILKALCEQEGV